MPVCKYCGKEYEGYWISHYNKFHCNYKFSKERNEKISKALKGRPSPLKGRKRPPRSKEWCEKLSKSLAKTFENGRIPWNKGYGDYVIGEKNPMYGHIRKVGVKCWCGKVHQKTPYKITKSRKGSNNPNWKGGIIRYPNWSELRKRCLERYGYRCVSCFRKLDEKRLVVHHIIPARNIANIESLRYLLGHIENLMPLCHSCHWKLHNGGKYKIKEAIKLSFNFVGIYR